MKLIFLCLAIILLNGCKEGKNFSHNFEQDQWNYKDSLQFVFNNENTQTPYEIRLKADFTQEFPYTNLYLKFRIHEPDGKSSESLTNFVLTDPSGKWLIPKSWNSYSADFQLSDSIRFDKIGTYQFWIIQYLREDQLKGIKNLQLQIIKK